MNRPPRQPGESVFSRGLSRKIISRGIQNGCRTVMVFAGVFYLQNDVALARTMAFCTLVLSQMFHVFDCRSEVLNIFEMNIFSNMYLVGAVTCSVLMQIMVIYLPFFNGVFETVPLTVGQWAIIIAVSGWTSLLSFFKYCFFHRRSGLKQVSTGYGR